MKLSKETLTILRNFASINPNLMIKPGNTIMTAAANKTAFAMATIEEDMPVTMGIYDLGELLGVVSIFTDPDLTFTEKSLTISEGKNKIRYMPADAEVLFFPKKVPAFPDADAKFDLPAAQLQQIMKASAVLKVPFMTIKGDGTKITVLVHDKANPNSNQFIIDVSATTDKEFQMHVKVDSLKMLVEDYAVDVSFAKVLQFVGKGKSYLVTCETDSSAE